MVGTWPPWLKANPNDLARYATPDAARWLAMPANIYDSPDSRAGRRSVVGALYVALRGQQIAYAWEKYDPSNVAQLIRTPAEILDKPHEGTCLDLALLFAGLCLACELIPVLIVLDGHALVAVNLERGLRHWDDPLRLDRKYFDSFDQPPAPQAGISTLQALQDFVRDGTYLAVECTGFAASQTMGTLAAQGFPESIGRDAQGLLPLERALAAGGEQLAFAARPLRSAIELAVARYVWKLDPLPIPGVPPRGTAPKLCPVPALPPNFLARSDELRPVKAALLAPDGPPLVGLWGMGGTGKSVSAAALARDLQATFGEVYWLTIGQTPNVLELQNTLYRDVTGRTDTLTAAAQAKDALSAGFGGRRALLVLDDVWDIDAAAAFAIDDPHLRTLITTRNSEILAGLSAAAFQLGVLDVDDSLVLLARWAGIDPSALPPEARDVADACGSLPLALALAGAMARLKTSWRDILTRLQRADLDKIANRFPTELYPYRTLLAAIGVSIDVLAADDRERYLDLAVFPDRIAIGPGPLALLWNLDEIDVRDCMTRFVSRSLATADDSSGEVGLRLHDLQRDVIRKEREATLKALHARLIDAWDAQPAKRDAYAWRWTGYHLVGAGRAGELQRRLRDGGYVCAKLAATDVNALIADYALCNHVVPNDLGLRTIEAAVELSAHVVGRDSKQLATQLTGRLRSLAPESPDVAAFLASLALAAPRPWLRPLTSTLQAPGADLIRTLVGHTWGVGCVAITPDGLQAISGGGDRTLKVWEIASGRDLRTLRGHTASVAAIAVTPDGRRVVSASGDKTVKVWDFASGREIFTLAGHLAAINGLAVTPNGRWAVSASNDYTLIVWDIERGAAVRQLAGHTREVAAVAVTPDGLHAVSASIDYTLKVWDLTDGSEVRTLRGHANSVLDVAITPDGARVVSAGGDGVLKVWDLQSGNEQSTFDPRSGVVYTVALTPDGRHAIAGAANGALTIWDLADCTEVRTNRGHSMTVCDVAVTPDGTLFISASSDQTLKIWSLDGLDGASGAPLMPLTSATSISAVAVTPDGTRAAFVSEDKTLTIWDLEQARALRTFAAHSTSIVDVAVTPDGERAVTASTGPSIKVWAIETGVKLLTIRSDTQQLWCVTVTPDGRRLVSGAWEHALNVRDIDLGTLVRTIPADIGFAADVAVTPDGRWIVAAGNDKNLTIWEFDTGRACRTLTGHTEGVTAVALTADGSSAVSGSRDMTLRVWDLATGAALRTLRGHTGWLNGVAVTPDGRHAVSASTDTTLRVWDLRSGANIATFSCDAEARCCAVTSRGTIVCGDRGGRLHTLVLEL